MKRCRGDNAAAANGGSIRWQAGRAFSADAQTASRKEGSGARGAAGKRTAACAVARWVTGRTPQIAPDLDRPSPMFCLSRRRHPDPSPQFQAPSPVAQLSAYSHFDGAPLSLLHAPLLLADGPCPTSLAKELLNWYATVM